MKTIEKEYDLAIKHLKEINDKLSNVSNLIRNKSKQNLSYYKLFYIIYNYTSIFFFRRNRNIRTDFTNNSEFYRVNRKRCVWSELQYEPERLESENQTKRIVNDCLSGVSLNILQQLTTGMFSMWHWLYLSKLNW